MVRRVRTWQSFSSCASEPRHVSAERRLKDVWASAVAGSRRLGRLSMAEPEPRWRQLAFCGLVLVFGSKLVSYDAASLPFGMVSEPRRRLEATPAGSLVEYLAVKMYFRVSAEFLELC